jgi:hypothetical protein
MTSPDAQGPRFQKAVPALRAFCLILYFAVVFLWFKGNFVPFKKIRISVWVALIPLILVVLVELSLRLRKRRIPRKPEYRKTALILLAVVLLAVAFRLPFLLYSPGMMWSDEAIPALMAKHIAEGQVPPICHYQQHYLGSLGSHIYALAFVVFGYSIPLLKVVTLLMFLAFVILQFFFFKDILSLAWAAVLAFFFSLPLGQLIDISTSNSNPYSLVLFLGCSVIYTAYAIVYKKKDGLWPLLGFLMGLSFWTHQITAAFILTALLILAFKARPSLKKYGLLIVYALAGVFPLLLQEVFDRFQLLQFVLGGEKAVWSGGKLQATVKLVQSLLFAGEHAAAPFLLLFLIAGIGTLFWLSFKKKEHAPLRIFLLFLFIFWGMYASSRFSDKFAVRYLFPLYACLPAILAAPFLWIRTRLKYYLFVGLLVVLVFLKNGQTQFAYFQSVKDSALYFERVIAAMKATGNRLWRGGYETSYVLTAISREQVIVDSFGVNKYWPYRLLYDNEEHQDSYVFLNAPWTPDPAQSNNLGQLLTKLGIPFQKKTVGDCSLFYGIESSAFPRILSEPVPSSIPRLEIERMQAQNGYLDVTFMNQETREPAKFRLNVEIPGFASASKMFAGSSGRVTCSVPLPKEKSFPLKYYLDYQALRIPSSVREISCSPSGQEEGPRQEPVVFLRGVSQKVRLFGRDVRFCEKEVRFEVHAAPGQKATVRLSLYSPFDFSNLYWYGNYTQYVRIILDNGRVLERPLGDGANIVTFDLDPRGLGQGPTTVELQFRYQLLFDFANLRKTAVLLEDAAIESKPTED